MPSKRPVSEYWEESLKHRNKDLEFVRDIEAGAKGKGEFRCLRCGETLVTSPYRLSRCSHPRCEGCTRKARVERVKPESEWHKQRSRGRDSSKAISRYIVETARKPAGSSRLTVTQLASKYSVGREVVYRVLRSLPMPVQWGYLNKKPT